MAVSVSASLASVAIAPRGNPATVQTFTGVPASSDATSGTQYPLTQTLANSYSRASAPYAHIVASGIRTKNGVVNVRAAIRFASGFTVFAGERTSQDTTRCWWYRADRHAKPLRIGQEDSLESRNIRAAFDAGSPRRRSGRAAIITACDLTTASGSPFIKTSR